MRELFCQVVPKNVAPTDSQFHAALVAGLSRAALMLGRGNLADKSGRTTRALDKVFHGSNPNAKGLLDFLVAEPTALDELLALYGYRLTPLMCDAAIDFEIIADSAALHAEHTEAMRNGNRDHRETIRIAEKARPVVAKYAAIIQEADQIKGARA